MGIDMTRTCVCFFFVILSFHAIHVALFVGIP
jgi:hypothetical protein